MSPSTYAVLETVVAVHRESSQPVTAREIAASLETAEDAIEHSLESLREFELVEPTGEGYRPTVTAHELLELDIEPDSLLVLDFVDE